MTIMQSTFFTHFRLEIENSRLLSIACNLISCIDLKKSHYLSICILLFTGRSWTHRLLFCLCWNLAQIPCWLSLFLRLVEPGLLQKKRKKQKIQFVIMNILSELLQSRASVHAVLWIFHFKYITAASFLLGVN